MGLNDPLTKQHDRWTGNIQLPLETSEEEALCLRDLFVEEFTKAGMLAYVVQVERGEAEGRLHIQFTFQWSSRVRKRTLVGLAKKQLGYEMYVNSLRFAAGISYSAKADTRVGETLERGTIKAPSRVVERKWSIRTLCERIINGATPQELQLEDPVNYFRYGSRIKAFYADWVSNPLRDNYVTVTDDEEE